LVFEGAHVATASQLNHAIEEEAAQGRAQADGGGANDEGAVALGEFGACADGVKVGGACCGEVEKKYQWRPSWRTIGTMCSKKSRSASAVSTP